MTEANRRKNIALALERSGRYDQALATYSRAMGLNPHPEKTRLRMAAAYQRRAARLTGEGDAAGARRALRQARDLRETISRGS